MRKSRVLFVAIVVPVVLFVMWSCPVEGAKPGEGELKKFLVIEFRDAGLPPLAGGEKLTPKTF